MHQLEDQLNDAVHAEDFDLAEKVRVRAFYSYLCVCFCVCDAEQDHCNWLYASFLPVDS